MCHKRVNAAVSVNSAVAVRGPFGTVKYFHRGNAWTGDIGTDPYTQPVCKGSTCSFPQGERVAMSGTSVYVTMKSNHCGGVEGLCGRFNPDVSFADMLDGLTFGSYFGGAYQSEFAESYALNATESAFSASECAVPAAVVPSPAPQPWANCPELQAVAEAKCPAGANYENCLFDVSMTCELERWLTSPPTPPGMTDPDTTTAAPAPAPTCELEGLTCQTDEHGHTLVKFVHNNHINWHCANHNHTPGHDCTDTCTCHPLGGEHRQIVHHNHRELCIRGGCGW